MINDPIHSDLNRKLDADAKAEAYADALDARAEELRGQWIMQLFYDHEAKQWFWQILSGRDCIADEWCKTEAEAWQGLRDGMYKHSKQWAKEWLESWGEE